MYYFIYLQDNNGTIENEELRGFLKDLLELVKKVKFWQIPLRLCVCPLLVITQYVSVMFGDWGEKKVRQIENTYLMNFVARVGWLSNGRAESSRTFITPP